MAMAAPAARSSPCDMTYQLQSLSSIDWGRTDGVEREAGRLRPNSRNPVAECWVARLHSKGSQSNFHGLTVTSGVLRALGARSRGGQAALGFQGAAGRRLRGGAWSSE